MAGDLPPEQLLDILSQVDPQSPFFRHSARVLDAALAPAWTCPPSPPVRKRLTIGMATHDDYDGVYFSVLAIRLYHPEITDSTEILVVDNQPGGPAAEALRKLEQDIPGYRYVPVSRISGTAVRDVVFREAAGDFVLCMDSHVLFAPGSLRALLDYFEAHPETSDLLQGPLVHDNLSDIATHFEPTWSQGMYGVWGTDPRGADPAAPPFEIPMQGLGVFACRRDAWPGFNPRLRNFGAEEGYIHEKFRRRGGRTLCLPFLRWSHRFARPRGVTYPACWEERIRNYMLVLDELQLDPAPVAEHFQTLVGPEITAAVVADTRRELAGPFHFFDAIYCINLDRQPERWQEVTRRWQRLGIAGRVRRFAAIETPLSHHIGCALSHREIIAEARRYGLRHVLVFEDDVVFAPDILESLGRSVAELRDRPWQLFYLGGCAWGQSFEKAEGCEHLEIPRGLTCTHAIAYHESVYDRILAAVPETPSEVALWLRTEFGVDQYYSEKLDGIKLLASPVVASQETILELETRAFDRCVDGEARATIA